MHQHRLWLTWMSWGALSLQDMPPPRFSFPSDLKSCSRSTSIARRPIVLRCREQRFRKSQSATTDAAIVAESLYRVRTDSGRRYESKSTRGGIAYRHRSPVFTWRHWLGAGDIKNIRAL